VLPGVYRVLAGDSLIAGFAVNPPPHASDVQRITVGEIASLLPDGAVRSASATGWVDAIFHQRIGREVSLLLLVTALLVLLVESALAATGKSWRRASATSRPTALGTAGRDG